MGTWGGSNKNACGSTFQNQNQFPVVPSLYGVTMHLESLIKALEFSQTQTHTSPQVKSGTQFQSSRGRSTTTQIRDLLRMRIDYARAGARNQGQRHRRGVPVSQTGQWLSRGRAEHACTCLKHSRQGHRAHSDTGRKLVRQLGCGARSHFIWAQLSLHTRLLEKNRLF